MQFVPFHSRDEKHKSILGSLQAEAPVRLSVLLPRSFGCSKVSFIFHRDGCPEQIRDMYWCGMNGDSEEWWDITLSYPEAGLYFYHFCYTTAFGTGNIFLKSGGMGAFEPTGNEWQQTVYDPSFHTPDWVKGGLIYQIFPDRFYCSGKQKKDVPTDRIMHRSFCESPDWQPDKHGKILNNDYFGGDLCGITQKLPYLSGLGVTIIYLNPIFEAHSNHRYNTADYLKIDPLLGTENDFKALCREAEKLGIRVILDGVFSHTGSDSIYFNRERRYGNGGAYNDKNSPFRPWYTFLPDGTYKSWWNIDTLPETNEDTKSFIEFITGENGVARKWLRLGASGYRLDVADELPDEFLDAFFKAVKSEKSDAFVIGEVWEDASNKISHGGRRRYLQGKQLDSVMNYPFASAILSFMRYGVAEAFMETVVTICENYPKRTVDCLMNHIGTHDTARILTRLVTFDLESKTRAVQAGHSLTPEEYAHAKELLKTAAVLQYTLPGIPSLYYGDEAGLTGGSDPFNRKCFPWGNEDGDLTAWYQKLGALRSELSCLKDGYFRPYSAMLSCVAYKRTDENEGIFVIGNRNPHAIDYSLPEDFRYKTDLLTGNSVNETVKVEAFSAAIIRK